MIGERVGHYQILEKLGSGGMGEVWLAEDIRLERRVVIKFLPYHAAQDEVKKARFIQEAKAAAKLSHSNIAQVFEIDEEEGRLYIVMEHVEGGSLSDRLNEAKGRSLPCRSSSLLSQLSGPVPYKWYRRQSGNRSRTAGAGIRTL